MATRAHSPLSLLIVCPAGPKCDGLPQTGLPSERTIGLLSDWNGSDRSPVLNLFPSGPPSRLLRYHFETITSARRFRFRPDGLLRLTRGDLNRLHPDSGKASLREMLTLIKLRYFVIILTLMYTPAGSSRRWRASRVFWVGVMTSISLLCVLCSNCSRLSLYL